MSIVEPQMVRHLTRVVTPGTDSSPSSKHGPTIGPRNLVPGPWYVSSHWTVRTFSQVSADMLTGANLDLVTAKTVRRSLEDHFKMDLSSRKKEIGSIINDIINTQDKGNCGTTPSASNDVKKGKRDRSPAEDDEELARKLQQEEEETQGKRATRSGVRGERRKSSNHSKKKAKTKKHVSDSSDSESPGSQSDGEVKGSKDKDKRKGQKGGYLVSRSCPSSHPRLTDDCVAEIDTLVP